ncbi:hypothetical protein [Winogradskyella forsetii]|nr:hypothetical protein [Winogradskyella forsetii]
MPNNIMYPSLSQLLIDPLDTRTWISMGIEAANHAPIEKPFNMGVLQV